MKLTKNVVASTKGYQPLPERLLLKGGEIIDPKRSRTEKKDVVIEKGKIVATETVDSKVFEGEIIDCTDFIISPGWLDMHVHLREPGFEGKETIATGSLAAANGGFTGVCCMPNTSPAIDNQEIIQYIKDRAEGSLVDVYPVAAITKDRQGKELSEILELVEQGAVAVSDDGNPVMSAEMMRRALEYSKMMDIPVIGHEEDVNMTVGGDMNEGFVSTCLGLHGIPPVAEEIIIARDIMLAEYTGARLHIAHISTAKAVDLVRQGKAKDIKVSAEATPHHFTLNEESLRSFDTNLKMSPPLRTEQDREAITQGLADGTIDTIASDHAPHSFEEKEAEFVHAPFGIIGLETTLGLSVIQLVEKKILSLKDLVAKFTLHPYAVLNLPIPKVEKNIAANLTIFHPNLEWKVSQEKFLSKSSNSPFVGWKLKGKPMAVINNGQIFQSIL